MKFYDLFAGIGGFRLGLERCGYECIGSCEIDKYARKIYSKHFNEEPYLDAKELKEIPKCDILCAGFPCQPFSIAGQRKGFEDTRGTIFFDIARIAKKSKPKYLLLENVKGLLNHKKGKTFKIILETLDELGYDVEWQVCNTKDFLPQNRERIFIIGHLRERNTRQVFPLGKENTKNEIKGGKKQERKSWISTLDSRYGERWSTETYVLTERRTKESKKIRKEYMKKGRDWSPRRGKELVPRKDNISNCITGEQTKEHYLLIKKPVIKVIGSTQKHAAIMYNQTPALTEAMGMGGGHVPMIDDVRIRRLTPTECERLQGFPDGWTEGISDTQRYKCLGNAVSVPVIEYIGKHIR